MHPSSAQSVRTLGVFASCAKLYNACLEQRRVAWKSYGRSVTYKMQSAELPEVRTLPEFKAINAQLLQDVLRRADLAFAAFFRRVKNGEKPGYPRFKSARFYDAIVFKQPFREDMPKSGSVRLHGNRISFSKLAKNVRFFQHRPIQGKIKTVTIKRRADKWFVIFSCDDVPSNVTTQPGEVGVDVGLTSFATLSNGEKIENPRFLRAAETKLAGAQRSLSRKKRGSRRRQKQRIIVARHYLHVANQRRDHAFKVARSLVERFDHIAIEDLNIKGLSKSTLSKSIHDVGWSQFTEILRHKAEEAGAVVIAVNPNYTSQDCSTCGNRVEKSLTERTHVCSKCNLILDRDVNAAINILNKARMEPAWTEPHERPEEARSSKEMTSHNPPCGNTPETTNTDTG
jgi:putative transposase